MKVWSADLASSLSTVMYYAKLSFLAGQFCVKKAKGFFWKLCTYITSYVQSTCLINCKLQSNYNMPVFFIFMPAIYPLIIGSLSYS